MKEIQMMSSVDSALDRANWAELLMTVYDRLVLDVQRGLEAQRGGDREQTMGHLTHALDIVRELQRSMRVEDHRGGYDLAALYEFLHRRLVMASVGQDSAVTDECLRLVTDLCLGWREAVEGLAMAAAERDAAERVTA
jgi:flagellar protein FliS